MTESVFNGEDEMLLFAFFDAFPQAAEKYETEKNSLLQNQRDCAVYDDAARDIYAFYLRKALIWSYIGREVHVVIDRPIGYLHRKEKYTLSYPVNYGYIPGVLGGDGEELDVYVLGTDEPLEEFDGRIIASVQRRDDVEDKLVAAPIGYNATDAEIRAAVFFQEKYYDSVISREFYPLL